MKDQMFAESEQWTRFELTRLVDSRTSETVAWVIFPITSEEE
jgi:hypothetical protein